MMNKLLVLLFCIGTVNLIYASDSTDDAVCIMQEEYLIAKYSRPISYNRVLILNTFTIRSFKVL